MIVDTDKFISAGDIVPDGKEVYVFVWGDGHQTLKLGDEVMMRETPDKKNVFVRISDLTLHSIFGHKGGAYTVVQRKEL